MTDIVPINILKAVVPPWLTELASIHELPNSVLIDFYQLESILSKEDVCFYYFYTSMSDDMLDGKAKDMAGIATLPRNMAWAEENKELLEKIGKKCEFQHLMEQYDPGDELDVSEFRKAYYVPQIAEDNVLVFLGYVKPVYRSQLEFYDAVVQELHKLTEFESLKQLALFDAYVQCERL